MSTFRLLMVALALLALTGCGRLFKAQCASPDAYARAENLPPLKVPAGLTAPNTRMAMPIPELRTPARPRGEGESCLDRPPRFSPEAARPGAPAAAPAAEPRAQPRS